MALNVRTLLFPLASCCAPALVAQTFTLNTTPLTNEAARSAVAWASLTWMATDTTT